MTGTRIGYKRVSTVDQNKRASSTASPSIACSSTRPATGPQPTAACRDAALRPRR